MKAMHDLIELVGGGFTDVHKFDPDTLVRVLAGLQTDTAREASPAPGSTR